MNTPQNSGTGNPKFAIALVQFANPPAWNFSMPAQKMMIPAITRTIVIPHAVGSVRTFIAPDPPCLNLRVTAIDGFSGGTATDRSRAHACSGDSVQIAAYLGASTRFDEAITCFAEDYADFICHLGVWQTASTLLPSGSRTNAP